MAPPSGAVAPLPAAAAAKSDPRAFAHGALAGAVLSAAFLVASGTLRLAPAWSGAGAAADGSLFGLGGGGNRGGGGGGAPSSSSSSSSSSSGPSAAAVAACRAQTWDAMRAMRDRVRTPGAAAEGTPLTIDLAHGADACGALGVPPPVYAPADVCYVVAAPGDDLGYVRVLNSSWFAFVPWPNLVVVGKADDPTLRVRSFPELRASPSDDPWVMEKDAMQVLFLEPQFAHCRWWVSATHQDWVNPRAVLNLVNGFSDAHRLVLGFVWHEMGWSHGVTYAGPQGIYSRAALGAALAVMTGANASACANRAGSWGPTDDFALDACMWATDAVHVHSNLFEPVGEFSPCSDWTWQQPHNLMSWVAVRNVKCPPRAFSLFANYYVDHYGPTNNWPSKKGFGVDLNLPPKPPIIGRRSRALGNAVRVEGEEEEATGAAA